jgi:CubicO group peptidase (beta-lactamase class C family)
MSITVRQLLQHTGGWDRMTSALADPVDGDGTVKASHKGSSGRAREQSGSPDVQVGARLTAQQARQCDPVHAGRRF